MTMEYFRVTAPSLFAVIMSIFGLLDNVICLATLGAVHTNMDLAVGLTLFGIKGD